MRFLGVDLAWKDGNPSGLVLLGGQKFPLHLRETPMTLNSHAEVLGWVRRHAAHHRAAAGIDAPLLGLSDPPLRRGCDNEISRAFGRFQASTHSPSVAPDLFRFGACLKREYGMACFAPDWQPSSARPAIREVYPHALQVLLFGLEEKPGAKILKYKRKHFRGKRDWAEQGLAPFIAAVRRAVEGQWVVPSGKHWESLVAMAPDPELGAAALKGIEDRWDALLCALAVALEFYAKGAMRAYPESADWRRGYVIAPRLRS